jgi:hypothetical protein
MDWLSSSSPKNPDRCIYRKNQNMVKRVIALVISVLITAAGLFQWASLWRYSAQTSGSISSFVVLTSNSSIFGFNSSEKSAVAGITFQTPDGQTHQFSYQTSRTDMPLHEGVPLRYDPLEPSAALTEVDYRSGLTQGIAITAGGGLMLVISSILWGYTRRKSGQTKQIRKKSTHRP